MSDATTPIEAAELAREQLHLAIGRLAVVCTILGRYHQFDALYRVLSAEQEILESIPGRLVARTMELVAATTLDTNKPPAEAFSAGVPPTGQ